MIVLSESSDKLLPSASARDIHAATEAAKLVGCTVYYIPQDFDDCGDAEGALWHVHSQPAETLGVWIGYIPTLKRYEQIYRAALGKNIRLINTPEQHQIAQEFDSAYPCLEGLTPRSQISPAFPNALMQCSNWGFLFLLKGSCNPAKHGVGGHVLQPHWRNWNPSCKAFSN